MSAADIKALKLNSVNSIKFSDVKFSFETETETRFIHAHKIILATNSIVFANMFSIKFETGTNVKIEDINYEIFLEIIKYLYTGDYAVSTQNMTDLLYAAQKYMLEAMKTELEEFIMININNVNILSVLDASKNIENPQIESMCLDLFLDNPCYFFQRDPYLNLSAYSMKKILEQPQINCTKSQLKAATLKWLKNLQPNIVENEFCASLKEAVGIEAWQLKAKQLFNIESHYYTGQFIFEPCLMLTLCCEYC
jgi:hypothetical protein